MNTHLLRHYVYYVIFFKKKKKKHAWGVKSAIYPLFCTLFEQFAQLLSKMAREPWFLTHGP
jgi:hypothetical protein